MAKVTYLLGAGASVGCIPVVENFSVEITKTLDEYNSIVRKKRLAKVAANLSQRLEIDLTNLANLCKGQLSVDTVAKMLYIKKDWAEYDKLKKRITLFLTLRQALFSSDVRYDNFWASILQHSDIVPDQINIVSWNYDLQVEQSFANFTSHLSISKASNQLHLASPYNNFSTLNEHSFNFIKLNGSAKCVAENGDKYFFDKKIDNIVEFLNDLDKRYHEIMKDEVPQKLDVHPLCFSWEPEGVTKYMDKLLAPLKDTESLVIIGYSFPVFNRNIDYYLLNHCMPKIRSVYVQAPPEDVKDVVARFKTTSRSGYIDKYVEVPHVRQFYFPNELNI